jgi:hypothetical protein
VRRRPSAALVGLLTPGASHAVQKCAVTLLYLLAKGHPGTQDCIRECGGVAALVALLAPGGSADVQAYAANMLRHCMSYYDT